MVWALVIALSIHLLAYLFYKMGKDVLEEGNFFLYGCGVFFVLYIAAAISMKLLIPSPGAADISSIPRAFMETVSAAE